jgi:multidrug efflux system membrane fusion protein
MMTIRIPSSASALLCSLAILSGCGQPAKVVENQPIPVKVQTVENRSDAGPTRYSGSLEPASRVELAFRVGGYVDGLGELSTPAGKRAIDKGDFVTKGTVLARIRAVDYLQKVKSADAALSEARAQEILAKEELSRARRLFEGNAITRAELDTKIARADSAKAQVEGAAARTGEAGISLSDTVLRAPMDGIVLSRSIEVGKLVAPGEPAITVADCRTVKAVFGAPQFLVEKLALGSPLTVFVGAESEAKSPEKLLSARITEIAPSADGNGRVFSVEAELPNPDGELRPGAVVSVRVPDSALVQDALVVPLSAVVRSPQKADGFSVFVLEGSAERARARVRNVSLGEVIGNGVTVTQGLLRSERVVTVGATLLRDGNEAVVIH